jgi:predicted MFS family arabinose efflux permease
MAETHVMSAVPQEDAGQEAAGAFLRTLVIGLMAFLTVVDLFATQAILPTLVTHYQVSRAAMGFAVNASTIGMAVSGLTVAFFSRRIDRRLGVLLSLALLSIPTALLAAAPDLTTFTILRIVQGLFMASAFTLTLAYLAEQCSAADAASASAAYITGNVASNLFGRLVSAALADHLGLATNFYVFAGLNLAGAVLVYFTLARTRPMVAVGAAARSPFAVWAEHLRNGPLRASFGIGFFILFAFIGTFTFVVLVGLALIGAGTVFAQAAATGFVGRAATTDRGSASGIYLACYFFGGIVGTAILGQVFDRLGWAACVGGIAVALAAASVLALRLTMPSRPV